MTKQNPEILVVDDEASIGQILTAGLEMHGFSVRHEANSADAIQAGLEFHPDLILLDIDMPGKDGGEIAAELRCHSTLQHTPVIFLTSLVPKQETGKLNASRELILSKQIRMADLASRIRAVLGPQPPR